MSRNSASPIDPDAVYTNYSLATALGISERWIRENWIHASKLYFTQTIPGVYCILGLDVLNLLRRERQLWDERDADKSACQSSATSDAADGCSDGAIAKAASGSKTPKRKPGRRRSVKQPS